MSDSPDQTDGLSHCMAMPSRLNAETVDEICTQMREAKLSRFKGVTLDFAAVDIFTTPGIQLMLALEKSLQETGGRLALDNVKPAIGNALRDLGFERFIQIH